MTSPVAANTTTPPTLDLQACALTGTQLIEASAGTGKTWAICALVLRLLVESRLAIGQVLVVTFTNAATAELRERIRARLRDALAAWRQPGSVNDAFIVPWLAALRERGLADAEVEQPLAAALAAFDDAAVFTIHGFCQRALADAAFSAGVPLQQTLLADDRQLRQQVVNDFWRREVAGDGLPPELAAHLLHCKDSPDAWASLVKRVMAKPMARHLWPADIDAERPDDLPGVDDLARARAELRALWREGRDELLQALLDALEAGALHKGKVKPDTLANGARDWDDWLASADATQPLPKDALLYTAGKLASARNKKGVLPSHPFLAAAQAFADAQARLLRHLALERLRLLRRLLAQAPNELAALKRQQRVVAFDDMLANLHRRLHDAAGGDALAGALRERFPAALIDEFQDTDPLQWAIFRRVHGATGAPLFLVGDPKQAIYGFRNADLATYLAARDEATNHHTLADNQRASAPLIHALNTLYGRHGLPFLMPGLQYHAVRCGTKPRPVLVDRSSPVPQPALQLWRLPRADDGRLLNAGQATAAAAEATAAEISRLLAAAQQGRVTLDARALAAGDIAVLVRSHRQGAAVRQALARRGVGSALLSQDSVYASADAEELETLLAAVLEPTREPLLRAALATVTLGLDAAALDALARDETAWLAQAARFADWRRLWLERGIGSLLRRLVLGDGLGDARQGGAALRLLSRPDGERRLTNLQHLAECLHQAARNLSSPEALLRWLQAQRADAALADEGAQLRLESDRHLVQIATIHKSKGLEYGLVFCPFLWSDGTVRAGQEGGAWLDDDGSTVIDFRFADDADALADNIKDRQRREATAESLRLVYVALTRAVHRCTVVVGAWGHGQYLSPKPAARGALGWLAAGLGADPVEWLNKGDTLPGADELDAAWQAFADAAAPDAALLPWPADDAGAMPLPPHDVQPGQLAALPPPAHIPSPWRIGSYSGLAHGARHELAAQDHDARSLATDDDESAAETPQVAVPPDDILAFPRGPEAGDCLHAVLELADFADPSTWHDAIDAALREHGPALDAAALRFASTARSASPTSSRSAPPAATPDARLLARQLHGMLADVLATPLTPGASGPPLRLADVPRSRRRAELDFHLPAHGLDAQALNRLLAEHGYPMPTLGFRRAAGWLKGFIDLVFCHHGRWWVLDWKSNHLGERPQDYRRSALDAAMARQGYHLQHLLYSVALERWLQLRLADYDPARHFGGVLYLFVRGVRPGWRDADGAPCGVWHHRPTDAVRTALSDLLDAPPPGAPRRLASATEDNR